MTHWRLYITAFIGGLVTLALELAAARLLAPAFGTSELVWTAIIGLILLYLAAGYALGGRWADRSPRAVTLYTILVAAGAAIAVIPLLARPALNLATRGMTSWRLGWIAGPFIVVLLLFVAPVTLLACVSPFAIRLSVREVQGAGNVAGRISALSTLGSFIGTFLPNLVLIPNIGTRRTFLLLALIAVATGLWGLWSTRRSRFYALAWLLIVLIALLLAPTTGPIKPTPGLIHETESTYNFIQVVERDATRYLLLNEGQGIHSVAFLDDRLLTDGPWDYFLIAPYFNAAPHPPEAVDSLLVIGLAAGTIPDQYTRIYGPLPIDGVEIDPEIVAVGRRFFGMTQPNLDVHVTDGRYFLRQTGQSKARYDVVAVDAYRLPYIPWHLTTVEFFEEVRAHLTSEGVVVINVGHTPGDWRLVAAMVATMRAVFPSVHVIDVPTSFNAIVTASVQPTASEALLDNLPLLADARLRSVAQSAHENLRDVPPADRVFTDDRAPIEQLTHDLAVRYLLGMSPP